MRSHSTPAWSRRRPTTRSVRPSTPGSVYWLGIVPGTEAQISLDAARTAVRRLWGELGFGPELAAEHVVPTPACGFAGATPAYVRRALSVLRDVGRALLDDAQ